MRLFLVLLMLTVSLGLAVVAEAETTQSGDACRSLDRPNIDCSCVERRIQTFERAAPNTQVRSLVGQGYFYSLGMENAYPQTLEANMQDPMAMVAAEQSFDTLGGRPENVDDYERACVIAGAPKSQLVPPPSWTFIEKYVDQCTLSTGDQRVCACNAERIASYVSEREFEAYYRSFADYADTSATSSADMAQSRGAAMGISGDAFTALQQQARSKFEPYEDRDAQYCAAMTAADQSEGFSAAERELAGFEEGAAMLLAPKVAERAQDTGLTGMAQTRQIVRQSCSADGNSAQYCQCYMQDFEARIVSASPSENATRGWALMTAGSSLEPTVYMQMVQDLPQSDHQAGAMLMMQTMDVGESCSQGPVDAAAKLTGTPYERMVHICMADNEDEALCACTISQMQSKLSEDDFELIADIREADFNGADDPLAVVAEERGLSTAEAEEAMAMNSAMMSGVMSMDIMACFGEMPTGLQMPFPMSLPGQQ